MRIYLDLIPGDRKEEIKRRKTFRKIFRQGLRFLFPVIFFIAILLAINLNLKIQLGSLDKTYSLEQSQEKYKELKLYEDKFREINARSLLISKFQEEHMHWSHIFSQLSNLVPEGVFVRVLTTKDYQISLAGKAKTREDLLAFQEKIKSSPCFTEINVPLSNLVSKENVDFQIDFKVQKNCLKK